MRPLAAFLMLFVFFLISGCQKNFEEINSDPNSPEKAPLSNLLTGGILITGDILYRYSSLPTSIISQHTEPIEYGQVNRYVPIAFQSRELWETTYKNLKNINHIIHEAQERNFSNYEGVAKVLRVINHSILVDLFGDIPISKSADLFENNMLNAPSFSSQEQVYKHLIIELKEASEILANAQNLSISEPIYYGNIKNWEKLSNSLLLRTLIKVSDLNEFNVSKEFQQLMSKPLFQSISDQAAIHYDVNESNQFPGALRFETESKNYVMNSSLIDRMIALNDPRISAYCDKNLNGDYVGIESGELGFFKKPSKVSSNYLYEPSLPLSIMTFSEQNFLLAEAAQLGFITGNSKLYFEKAINADFEENSISSQLATDYLSNSANYDASVDPIKLIHEQFWIATFFEGIEAFNIVRRTQISLIHEPQRTDYIGMGTAERFPYPISQNNQSYYMPKLEESLREQNLTGTGSDIFVKLIWAK